MEELQRHISRDPMNHYLSGGGVEVEGDSSRNSVEMLPYSSIKLGGEEVFHQSDGHISSITTGSATRNLGG
jgi:hypothetical protein